MNKDFETLYNELYNANRTELEQLRELSKQETNKLLMTIACMFGGIILASFLGLGIIAIPLIIYVIVTSIMKAAKDSKNGKESNSMKYKRLFKQNIVAPLITSIFSGAQYIPNEGWTRQEYKEAGYRDDIDRYSSEDYVKAPYELKDGINTVFEFAEVHTERESRDSDGDRTYSTVFYGVASRMKIDKDIGTEIYIKRNWSSFAGKRVKLDMPEFEKEFDVESEDQIMAVRVLTADVMAEMIDMKKKYKYPFEIHIVRDKIYMRVSTGEVFEPNIYKEALEKETLLRYYNVIEAMMHLSKHIYTVIDEIVV